jgi:hypothetical protein
MDEASIQWRRAKWFEYVRRRFDLVSFGDLADWIATGAGNVRRNEADREQALVDLEDSVKRGEFGPADEKRCIPWLPKPPRSDMRGKLCLRLNYGQIVRQGASVISDLYASRALCLKWLEARQIRLPPWLKHPEPPAGKPTAATIESAVAESTSPAKAPATAARIEGAVAETSDVQQPMIEGTAQPNKGTKKLPPFDEKKATIHFVAQKTSGDWREPPTENESKAYLRKHFSGVPNDPHRKLRHRVWPGQIRRGRKRKSIAAD